MDSHYNDLPSLQYFESVDTGDLIFCEESMGINLFIFIWNVLWCPDDNADHSLKLSSIPASMPTPKIPAAMLDLINCMAMSDQTQVNPTLPHIPDMMHPGPPWFRVADTLGHPPFQVLIGGELVTLPYLWYQETHGDVYLLGTEGKDRPMHYQAVLLGPAASIDTLLYDNYDVNLFLQDPTFNTNLAQALNQVDNLALMAEVAHFCNLNTQLPLVTLWAFFLDKACQALVDL